MPDPLACGSCGPVDVDPCAVDVHVNTREDFVLYAFACPGCGELVTGGRREVARELLEAGARWRELRSMDLPPLNHDDLLDLHLWLHSDQPWPGAPAL